MKFTPGDIEGMWIIETQPVVDHRGYFARVWCEEEFAHYGLKSSWPQQNLQHSPQTGTMRGLHYQVPPHAEIKLVRCTRGSVFDVAVDLRPGSPTYGHWVGNELSADTHDAVWVPRGCAHGYVTLEPNSDVFYLTSNEYVPESVRGIRYDDPRFNISWPISIDLVPDGYDTWTDFTDEEALELAPLSATTEQK
jgi:dTDP-4-dehydrorhamnose 3,5-epimerase